MIRRTGLHKEYGTRAVLCGVDLSVDRGEVAVLVGPSGGGKTTFLRCLNGLDTFDRGMIEFDRLRIDDQTTGRDRERLFRKVRQRLGMVFQSFHLFPHRTVIENVIEGPIHVLGVAPSDAEERGLRLLERVGLADRARAWPAELSGGQQQRVAIARALAMEPHAMLFDEPTSNLDPKMTTEVLSVLADLAREGQTMVVVTHAMNFARRAAHRVHVFHEGQVVESGPPDQIFSQPLREETKRFLQESDS